MMVDDIKTDGASTPYYLSQAQSYEGISTDPIIYEISLFRQ